MHCYDKDGEPISVDRWGELAWRSSGELTEYARIGLDNVGAVRVSTVWLGLDHNWSGDGGPLIFETMLFGYDEEDAPMTRYHTEREARCGHARVLADLREGRQPWFLRVADDD